MDERPPVIIADHLTKRFGEQYAVSEVTFSIPPGLIFGYVGPSGSGKTTTIKLLLGLLRPTEGEVRVLGLPPFSFDKETRTRIGYMPQFFALYPGLTVRQNMHFAGRIYGFSLGRRKVIRQLLEFVELSEHAHKLAGDISGGMQRRLSLAATLLHDPQLVFLDEPTAGVDPVLRRKFWDEFRVLQSQGRTLFITTQYVSEVENCDLVGVMRDGQLIAVDSPDNLRRQAYGGERLTLEAADSIPAAVLERMAGLPFVQSAPLRMVTANTVRLVVDDAKTAIPELLTWAQAQGLDVVAVEPSTPVFEDVFVELIRKSGGHEAVTNGEGLVNKLVRASAFFTKEISEIIRQPRLILTLIVGPFLILLLFGLGYQTNYPPVRALYVVAPDNAFGKQLETYMKELGSGLTFAGSVATEAEAMRRLKDRQADLVVVAPQDLTEALRAKQQLPLKFYYNEVDPLQSDHLNYIAQLMVSVLNRHLVEQALAQGQAGSGSNAPATVVAQPYQAQTNDVAASTPTPAQFFAPAVIILLLQHLGVTFGALSLVRERQLGSLDLFRVSPLTAGETLAGKYVSYYLFGAVIVLLLVVLLVLGFNVPMEGSWLLLGFGVGVVLLASLGWGFVISGLSRNDSQAVQYSMMVLLASFFFSGFVLSLQTLSEPVRVVSRILPATYGIAFAQSVMLRGEGLNTVYTWSVVGLALFLMLLAWLLVRRQLRRA